MSSKQICNECGRSVKFGSGLFVNRVSDFNDFKTKIEMNKPFPNGDYICYDCEEQINISNKVPKKQ